MYFLVIEKNEIIKRAKEHWNEKSKEEREKCGLKYMHFIYLSRPISRQFYQQMQTNPCFMRSKNRKFAIFPVVTTPFWR